MHAVAHRMVRYMACIGSSAGGLTHLPPNTCYLKAFDKRDLSRDEVSALSPPASPQRGGQPKYTPLTWQEVGRSLLLA